MQFAYPSVVLLFGSLALFSFENVDDPHLPPPESLLTFHGFAFAKTIDRDPGRNQYEAVGMQKSGGGGRFDTRHEQSQFEAALCGGGAQFCLSSTTCAARYCPTLVGVFAPAPACLPAASMQQKSSYDAVHPVNECSESPFLHSFPTYSSRLRVPSAWLPVC